MSAWVVIRHDRAIRHFGVLMIYKDPRWAINVARLYFGKRMKYKVYRKLRTINKIVGRGEV